MNENFQVRLFTLIELLVVVAVIAILASLLLPTLGTTRDAVKRIACANNQRNIYQGTFLYIGDSDAWLPPSPGYGFATYYLNAYLRQPYKSILPMSVVDGIKALNFTKMGGLYFCPAITSASSSPFWSGAAEPSLYYSSYNATIQASNDPRGGSWLSWGVTSRKIDSIYGNCVLFTDRLYWGNDVCGGYVGYAISSGYTSHWQRSIDYPWYAPAFIHMNTCNFAFKDGHIQSIKYSGSQLFDSNYVLK